MTKKDPKLGEVVLLRRGLIGVVKYIGKVNSKDGQAYGIKLGEGTGDCNGTFQGTTYFKCPDNKGTFVTRENIKKILTGEVLLNKVVELNKKVKQKNAEISKLNDELTLTQKKIDTFHRSGGEVQIESDSDESIGKFLTQEYNKKWYISLHDLCARYPERKLQDTKNCYQKFEAKMNALPEHPGHTRIVYTVCASKRDNLIGSGSDDKTIRLWRKTPNSNSSNNKTRCLSAIQLRSCINSLAFSPDGQYLAAALDSGWIELYDLKTGKMVGALEGQTTSEVWTICFSPDGSKIISGALDRAVRIWDVRERECGWALRGHDEWVNGVAVSGDGTKIVSGSGDKTVRVWDTRTMKVSGTLRGHSDFVRSVCVMDDSEHVVSASDDCELRVWNMSTSECVNLLRGHTKGIYSVSAGVGKLVASASRDHTVKIWNIDTTRNPQGKFCQEFKEHRGDVNSCAFLADGKYVVSGSDDKQVIIFGVDEKLIK